MRKVDEKTRRFATTSLFPSLFLSAFGVALVQAWAVQMGGSWRLHAILGIPGLALSGLALYRARLHWSAGIPHVTQRMEGRRLALEVHDLVWYMLLFGAGILACLSASIPVSLGVVALLMYLVPWAKIPVCRSRFVAASIVILAGAVAGLALGGKPVQPLHYAAAAWMVTFPSMMMLSWVLLVLPDGYRMHGDVNSPAQS